MLSGTRTISTEWNAVEFIRFRTTQMRDPCCNCLQIAQLVVFDVHGTSLPLTDATNPGGRNPPGEEPAKALDGTPTTKWLDFHREALECRLAKGAAVLGKYMLVTANDCPERDPIRWVLEGRNSAADPWRVLDDKSGADQPMPDARFAAHEVVLQLTGGHQPSQLPSIERVLNPPEEARQYSSVWEGDAIGQGHARSMLDSPQGWSAGQNCVGEWMVIDAGNVVRLIGIVVTTRGDSGTWPHVADQLVETLRVEVSDNGVAWLEVSAGLDTGLKPSEDSTRQAHLRLPTEVRARLVRLTVLAWHAHISLRAGLLIAEEEEVVLQPRDTAHEVVLQPDGVSGTAVGNGFDTVGTFNVSGEFKMARLCLTKQYVLGTGDPRENSGHAVELRLIASELHAALPERSAELLRWGAPLGVVGFYGTWHIRTRKYSGDAEMCLWLPPVPVVIGYTITQTVTNVQTVQSVAIDTDGDGKADTMMQQVVNQQVVTQKQDAVVGIQMQNVMGALPQSRMDAV
jgi:hypothetical protein